MIKMLWMAGLALIAAVPLAAQETRVEGAAFPSPPATIDQMWWLEGLWQGEGIERAPATESWLPRTGTAMVGTFIQQTAEGGIMLTEHMQIMEEGGSLVLKLKHFNPDLTGWEEKDGMVTFRLLGVEHCLAQFQALTLRCDGPDKLVVAVRMKSDAPEPRELLFRFDRAARSEGFSDCDGSTIEMNECVAAVLERSTARKNRYLAAAVARHNDQTELVAQIKASDAAFTRYADTECGAIYEAWKEGSIRTIMDLSCRIARTDERTRVIWRNWLTYMDSTPPDLPEPGPSH